MVIRDVEQKSVVADRENLTTTTTLQMFLTLAYMGNFKKGYSLRIFFKQPIRQIFI